MKLYNSLTFQKEKFKSIHPNEVLMYVCGPTVYDSPHLGHAKSALTFDIVRRFLKFKGHNVKLVKNYTDIDDKIIDRANKLKIDYTELTEKYIKEYEQIMDLLNIEKDYKNPRATEVIDFMIEMIQGLIQKGHAYESNGSVYFDITTFPKYKTLLLKTSKETAEEEEEENHTHDDEKRSPKDFALWKQAKENEPFWESPWGQGRPGWHIECSAMTIKFLGETIDIHGGGQDLKFPHHRNEISQSEAYTGKIFANYFMHNGFVNVDNEKMSKSLGNFFLVSDVAKIYDPMVIRWFLLTSHYRKSINYSLETMTQAEKNYNKFIKTIKTISEISEIEGFNDNTKELISKIQISKEKIIVAMEDDFNTPIAIAEILMLFNEINSKVLEEKIAINKDFKSVFLNFIEFLDKIFGIFPNLEQRIMGIPITMKDENLYIIENLLKLLTEVRIELRGKKLYEISDKIRDKLNTLGFDIEDR